MAAAVHPILVVSDLHLGGRPASGPDPGFQMCPPASRRRLARFIHRLAAPAGLIPPGDTRELLINGDFIDFLAEEPFAAFTGDASVAITKLQRTIRLCDEGSPEGERVFSARAELVERGHRLTILLGNHDIELALPQVRWALVDGLT